MKHHPGLFDARTLTNDTRLLFKLKLLLGSVCAYGGEVPLTNAELAKRMNTDSTRVRMLIQKLLVEGVVRYSDEGKLFFNHYVFVNEKDEITKEGLYAKFFNFFICEEFLNERRTVQRFVLHYVGHELVYLSNIGRWGSIKSLYGTDGLLNIRTRKEAIQVLKEASKYLNIQICENDFHVKNLRREWIDMGETYSQGAELWVLKQLKKHKFHCDFISNKAIWQMAKVMEDYYVKFNCNYEYATDVFDTALYNLQKNKLHSQKFLAMIYKNDEDYIVTPEKNDLEEISAYFRAVMESAELNYAKQLSLDLGEYQEKQRKAERNLFQDGKLNEVSEKVMADAKEQIQTVWKKLISLQQCWLNRFRIDPEWFLQLRSRNIIESLPAPIKEIKDEIHRYLKKQTFPK